MLSVFISIAASNPFASPFLLLLSSNTGHLHLDHLQWQYDSLVVYFADQNNDQQGKRASFLRHLFCNPFNKYVCPVFPIRPLNVLDVKHLARGKVRFHEYGNLMDVTLQHVDVVAMGSRPSDSVVSFWSAQASAAVFDLVRSSDGIISRRKKRLESLYWITLYKMMVEINKYEEKLMLLEMVWPMAA
jgi:hypothetical protein